MISACAQKPTDIIKNLDVKLASKDITVSQILQDTAYMDLHSLTAFRDLIKKYAYEDAVTMITLIEPGTRITIKGKLTDEKAQPVKNALIYVYQTSDKGWYSDTAAHVLLMEGDMRHARLFAYLRTNNEGHFTLYTIMPKGYPGSDLAAHIHIQIWDANGEPLRGPGELQFEEDPRMTDERKERSLEEGYLISRNSGTKQNPIYEYVIKTEKF